MQNRSLSQKQLYPKRIKSDRVIMCWICGCISIIQAHSRTHTHSVRNKPEYWWISTIEQTAFEMLWTEWKHSLLESRRLFWPVKFENWWINSPKNRKTIVFHLWGFRMLEESTQQQNMKIERKHESSPYYLVTISIVPHFDYIFVSILQKWLAIISLLCCRCCCNSRYSWDIPQRERESELVRAVRPTTDFPMPLLFIISTFSSYNSHTWPHEEKEINHGHFASIIWIY